MAMNDIAVLNNAYPLKEYDDNSKQSLLAKAVRYVELKTRGFKHEELLTNEEKQLVKTWLIPELKANNMLKSKQKQTAKATKSSDKAKKLKLLKLKSKAAKAKLNLLKLK